MLVRYNSVFVPLCSPNTCKDVFNPNVTAFQSNCAEGLHFSVFVYFKKIPRAHAQEVKQSPIVLSVSPAPVFEMQAILLSLNNFKLFENLKNMIWSIFSSCYIAIHVYNNYIYNYNRYSPHLISRAYKSYNPENCYPTRFAQWLLVLNSLTGVTNSAKSAI